MTIGRLERVSLREVWQHEAYDFTTWLRDNVEVLNDELDITIANLESEQAAGRFSVDLVGEDEAGNAVVIENQLEKSDHDHLGKLITYLTAFEAKTAIWIVSNPRPEHIAAIAWLNQSTPASFYMFKVEAVRIGDSMPAPMLTKIVGPSEESREVGDTKKEIAERHQLRYRFWSVHLDRARERSPLFANISPNNQSWINTGSGRSGVAYTYIINERAARIELYIDTGNADMNLAIYDYLHARHDEIELTFGGPLDWQRLEGKKACRIAFHISTSQGYRSPEDDWPGIQDQLIEAMDRFEHALRPHMHQLPR